MDAIQFSCPHCGRLSEADSPGFVSCQNCGQAVDIQAPKQRIGVWKKGIDNGLGWWTTVTVAAWAFFIIPACFYALAGIVSFLPIGMPDELTATMGTVLGIVLLLAGLVFAAMGVGLIRWARGAQYQMVCSECGNHTHRHALKCATCSAAFD